MLWSGPSLGATVGARPDSADRGEIGLAHLLQIGCPEGTAAPQFGQALPTLVSPCMAAPIACTRPL